MSSRSTAPAVTPRHPEYMVPVGGRRRSAACHLAGGAPPDRHRRATCGRAILRLTDRPGFESHAEISADGRFAAFLSDRQGQFDPRVSPIGTWKPANSCKRYRRSICRRRFSVLPASKVTPPRSGSVPQRPGRGARRRSRHEPKPRCSCRSSAGRPGRSSAEIRSAGVVSGRHAAGLFPQREGRSTVRGRPDRRGRPADFSQSTEGHA